MTDTALPHSRSRLPGTIDARGRGPSVNLATPAYGAVATANSYYSTDIPSNVIDGNDTTYWNCNGTGLSAWIRIDLDWPRVITAYRVLQYTGYSATSWQLQYSTDDYAWNVAVASTTYPGGTLTAIGTDITARYWRIIPFALQGFPYWDIYTFELHGWIS